MAEVSGVFIGFGALIGATKKHSAVITILLRTLVVNLVQAGVCLAKMVFTAAIDE